MPRGQHASQRIFRRDGFRATDKLPTFYHHAGQQTQTQNFTGFVSQSTCHSETKAGQWQEEEEDREEDAGRRRQRRRVRILEVESK